MKALVLSGGSGMRLRPFSHSMAKQLMPIANRPVLEYVLSNIRALGVSDIGVVVGDRAADIMGFVGDGSRFGARVTYIHQDRPLGLAHCVILARSFLGDDDFVMYLGDNMLPEGVVDAARDFAARRPDAQVLVHRVADPRAFGVVELDADGRIERLVEKPEEPRSDLGLIGVYFFTPAVHEAVAAIGPSARGELEITDAVQWLVARGADVRASEYTGFWKDTGRAEDVLECNRRLLESLRPGIAGEIDAGCEIRGAVAVEAGARLVRSRVQGPVIIGAGSVVEDSHIGPRTSIGRGCVLRHAGVAGSIVLDNASVSGVAGLHDSIIGRNASVSASAGHRLVVGDDTRIEVPA
ncbi:glucose-1-phosphate thymidylyltransferase [Actinomadura sp. DSM 109109]|nr:glucose-1-phosphate thymidylyltransferase [Actinomadura lepetitiana]